jgi:hypothetical protein
MNIMCDGCDIAVGASAEIDRTSGGIEAVQLADPERARCVTQEPFLVTLYRLAEHPLHLTLAAERPVWNHKLVIERFACRHHHRLPLDELPEHHFPTALL